MLPTEQFLRAALCSTRGPHHDGSGRRPAIPQGGTHDQSQSQDAMTSASPSRHLVKGLARGQGPCRRRDNQSPTAGSTSAVDGSKSKMLLEHGGKKENGQVRCSVYARRVDILRSGLRHLGWCGPRGQAAAMETTEESSRGGTSRTPPPPHNGTSTTSQPGPHAPGLAPPRRQKFLRLK